MLVLTDEFFEQHTRRLLEWMRSANPYEDKRFPHSMTVILGLDGTLTQAREEEFIDAFRLATQNGVDVAELVFDSACSRGGMRLVQFLLPTVGAGWVDSDFSEPLTKAASSGHVGVVQFLLAQLSTRLSDQVHLLMLRNAVGRGHVEMVAFLLTLAGENFDVNAWSEDADQEELPYGSLLKRALYRHQVGVVSVLLSHGASGLHDTPEIMMLVSSVAMAELLYAHGADLSGEVGLKMAIRAIERGDDALFFFLLDHGADIRRLHYTTTKSPFHATCSLYLRASAIRQSSDFVGDLFSRAIVDIDARGADGLTALQSLVAKRKISKEELIKKLVDLGASTEGCEGLEQ